MVWIISILVWLMGLYNNHYQFLASKAYPQEFDGSISSSSIWMPAKADVASTRQVPVVVNNTSPPPPPPPHLGPTTKDYSDPSLYWRYDDAAPPVRYATTHQLSSLPQEYRLDPLAFKSLTEYLQQPQNVYPQKLHVFETNPSITILPQRYQKLMAFEGSRGKQRPVYLASYRLTNEHNCFGHTERGLMYGGGDWTVAKNVNANYLGIALLSKDLQIIADVIVLMNEHRLERVYRPSDFRLFTIHNDLFLSTAKFIGRLQLGLPGKGQDIPPASEYDKLEHLDKEHSFSVYLHRNPSCTVRYSKFEQSAKNLLYFVDDNNETMVEYWPSGNPNDVRAINLKKQCMGLKKPRPAGMKEEKLVEASASFHNFHQAEFAKVASSMFTFDRGSACCSRMTNPWTGKDYLVGVAHPETPFPGNTLPEGVEPNIYFSRFFAMEASKPYTIISRSGAFCFGYSNPEEVKDTVLWNEQSIPMTMGNATFRCPKIHFVMSMVDNVANNSQVIISYGVSDCTSRFIMVNKVDIQAMLWPHQTAKP